VDFTVAAVGTLGVASLHANGMFTYNKSSNSNYIGTNFLVIDDTDFDTTIINTLDITAKWGAASLSNSIQSQNFNLFRIF
jgi:VCBS repeat-containing protein